MAPLRFTAPRSLRCASFTVNVGAPLVTPGTPPHLRHDGRVHRSTFVAVRDDAARSRCGGSRCALPGTGRHEWRPYGSPRRTFIAARLHCTAPVHTVNVGAPLVTPGTPPRPRHDGRVHRRAFPLCRTFISVRDDAARFRCGGSRCALPGTGRHEWRPYGSPRRVHCRAFIAPRRFAPSNVGAPPRTPGTPPHPRHDGRFIAARPLQRETTRRVPVATVHVVPYRAPGVMNGAPTVHRAALRCGGADKHGGPPR